LRTQKPPRFCSDEFGANFTNEIMMDAVRSIALDHRYDPACDVLDAAEAGWDGSPKGKRRGSRSLAGPRRFLSAR
jgi:hypothetical protein